MDLFKAKAEELSTRFRTRDPKRLAEALGITVWYRPLGGLKGFFLSERGYDYIVINEELPEDIVKVVTAHELGHFLFHRELSAEDIRRNTLLLRNDKTEAQANRFAAELLITDKEISWLLDEYDSVMAIAGELSLPEQLVSIKLKSLKDNGMELNLADVRNDFLAY